MPSMLLLSRLSSLSNPCGALQLYKTECSIYTYYDVSAMSNAMQNFPLTSPNLSKVAVSINAQDSILNSLLLSLPTLTVF